MEKKVNLFCITHAGGSSNIFNEWKNIAEKYINIIPIELKGRGKRFGEQLYGDLDECVEDIYNCIKNQLNEKPFAVFGHSMGGLLAYELTYKLYFDKSDSPVHLFLSSKIPPHSKISNSRFSDLPNHLFLEEIKKMGGTSQAFFEQKELVDISLPIIKNDFRMIDNYIPRLNGKRISCDTTVIFGEEEEIEEEMSEWSKYTEKECRVFKMKGGHFYLNEHKNDLIELINCTLGEYIN